MDTPINNIDRIISKIKSNERVSEVLAEIAQIDTASAQALAPLVNDNDVTQAGIWISGKVATKGVEATLVTGGLLYFHHEVTDADDRRKLFDNLLEDIGISRSQAYRCISVWEHFGLVFIQEPTLCNYFVSEAAKILSQSDIPQLARDEAIKRAQKKERIRIAQANELRQKHLQSTTEVAEKRRRTARTKTPASPKSENPIWSFVGKSVRLILQPAKAKSRVDLAAIIKDLEAALADFRKQYDEASESETQQVA